MEESRQGGEVVQRLTTVLLVVLLFLVTCPAWALDLEKELSGVFSEVDGSITVGDPLEVGEYTIVPIVRWRVLVAGNDPEGDFAWQAGGLEIEPLALVVIGEEAFQVFHITGEELPPDLIVGPELLPLGDEEFDERLNRGTELMNAGELDLARRDLEVLILQRPGSAEAHALLGQIYGLLADKTPDLGKKIRYGMDAFREFARALDIDPENPRALMARGYARMLVPPPLGGMELAVEDFHLALVNEPGLVPALNGLGEVFVALGEYDKAQELFEQALAIEPENQQALRGLNTIKEGENP